MKRSKKRNASHVGKDFIYKVTEKLSANVMNAILHDGQKKKGRHFLGVSLNEARQTDLDGDKA